MTKATTKTATAAKASNCAVEKNDHDVLFDPGSAPFLACPEASRATVFGTQLTGGHSQARQTQQAQYDPRLFQIQDTHRA